MANEEVFVGLCCSLELSEGGRVDCELRVGDGTGSDGADVKDRVLVTRSRVVFGSWGTLMPKLRATWRKW